MSRTTSASTRPIVAATLVGILAVFAFQAVGTRTLGPVAYAPIGQLWTVYFLAFTMFLLPIEQMVTQRLALAGGDLTALQPLRRPIIVTTAVAMIATGGFVAATLDRNFEGEWWYVPAAVLLTGVYLGFALTRGITAGQLRLRDYAIAVAAESLVRLIVAVVLLSIFPTPASLVVAMIVAGFAGLAGRPWAGESGGVAAAPADDSGQLTGLVIGTVAAQVILASGPIVVSFLGGSAREVSVVFVSFVLLRGPLTSSYNFLSRILHWIALELRAGRTDEVRRRMVRGLTGATLAAGLAAGAAAAVGPTIVAGLYGADFRPSPALMATGAAGVVVAAAALFVGLTLIANGRTGAIAAAWIVALAVMIVVVMVVEGPPGRRFATGFLVGEVAAAVLLTRQAFRYLGSGADVGI